ncbi:unnamed protein product [Orchesella dallaii]|uniref:Uncharacterized protein n=1 Tax=Orchesella dallaii TaxID=48710 RepID=A0ABP1RUG6_9HEXA
MDHDDFSEQSNSRSNSESDSSWSPLSSSTKRKRYVKTPSQMKLQLGCKLKNDKFDHSSSSSSFFFLQLGTNKQHYSITNWI